MTNVKLLLSHSNTWNHLTEQKMSAGSFKNVINKIETQPIDLFTNQEYLYLYKQI